MESSKEKICQESTPNLASHKNSANVKKTFHCNFCEFSTKWQIAIFPHLKIHHQISKNYLSSYRKKIEEVTENCVSYQEKLSSQESATIESSEKAISGICQKSSTGLEIGSEKRRNKSKKKHQNFKKAGKELSQKKKNSIKRKSKVAETSGKAICGICQMPTSNLANHNKIYHKKIWFYCNLCEFSTKMGSIFRHLKKEHQISNSFSAFYHTKVEKTGEQSLPIEATKNVVPVKDIKMANTPSKKRQNEAEPPKKFKTATKRRICEICQISTANLKRHKTIVHNKIRTYCSLCNFSTKWDRSIQRHLKAKHGIFENFLDFYYKKVSKNSDENERYFCSFCPLSFTYSKSMENHLERVHQKNEKHADSYIMIREKENVEKPSVPPRAEMTSQVSLKDITFEHHEDVHDGRVKRKMKKRADPSNCFSCALCETTKVLEKDIKIHLKKSHQISQDFEEFYAKTVETRSKIKREEHFAKSENVKILDRDETQKSHFYCEICSFKSHSKFGIRLHVRKRHHGLKKKKQFVQKPKIDKSSYDKYKKLNRIKWRFSCLKCPYETTYSMDAKAHSRDSHGIIQDYERHFAKSVNEKVKDYFAQEKKWPFSCSVCKFNTCYKKGVKSHLNRLHGIKTDYENYIENEKDTCDKKIPILVENECEIKQEAKENKIHLGEILNNERYFAELINEIVDDATNDAKRKIRSFSCQNCQFYTIYKSQMKRHLSSVHKINENHEDYCIENSDAATKKALWEKYAFFCQKCGFSTLNLKCIKEHLFRAHGIEENYENHYVKNPNNVDIPTKETKRKIKSDESFFAELVNEIIDNVTKETKQKIFACRKCKFNTNYFGSLKRHLSKVHGIFENYKEHFSKKFKEEQFSCQKCDFKTKYKISLKRHLSKIHGIVEKYEKHYVKNLNENYKKVSNPIGNDETKYSKRTRGKKIHFLYSCQKCPFTSIYRSHAKIHLRNVHGIAQSFEEHFTKSANEDAEMQTSQQGADVNQSAQFDEKLTRPQKHFSCNFCTFFTDDQKAIQVHLEKCHKEVYDLENNNRNFFLEKNQKLLSDFSNFDFNLEGDAKVQLVYLYLDLFTQDRSQL